MKKILVLIAALALVLTALVGGGAALAYHQSISTTVFYACENTSTGAIDSSTITQDSGLDCSTDGAFSTLVNWSVTGPKGDAGPAGPQGAPGVQGTQGATGPVGPAGTPGTNGTNGSNVLTSQGAPTGACTTGDTDIDISGGEVYSCVSSAWSDTNNNITGPQGKQGLQGNPGATGPQGASGVPFTGAPCSESYTNGAEQQENLLFCLSGVEKDGNNVYLAAVTLAKNYHLIVGTPISTAQTVDWNLQTITYVEFTSGFHAEYHADNVVRIYNDVDHQVF